MPPGSPESKILQLVLNSPQQKELYYYIFKEKGEERKEKGGESSVPRLPGHQKFFQAEHLGCIWMDLIFRQLWTTCDFRVQALLALSLYFQSKGTCGVGVAWDLCLPWGVAGRP